VLQNPQGPQTHNLTIGSIVRLLKMSQPVRVSDAKFSEKSLSKIQKRESLVVSRQPDGQTIKCEDKMRSGGNSLNNPGLIQNLKSPNYLNL